MPRAMFNRMLLLFSAPEPEKAAFDDVHLAVGVLLVEAARMDDSFDGKERGVIARFLTEKFGLSEHEREELVSQAEELSRRSTQLHPFTRTAFTKMAPAERMRLIEMLWEVAYADGVLDPEEDALLRRVAGLIYVGDEERVDARRRVLARLAHGNGTSK